MASTHKRPRNRTAPPPLSEEEERIRIAQGVVDAMILMQHQNLLNQSQGSIPPPLSRPPPLLPHQHNPQLELDPSHSRCDATLLWCLNRGRDGCWCADRCCTMFYWIVLTCMAFGGAVAVGLFLTYGVPWIWQRVQSAPSATDEFMNKHKDKFSSSSSAPPPTSTPGRDYLHGSSGSTAGNPDMFNAPYLRGAGADDGNQDLKYPQYLSGSDVGSGGGGGYPDITKNKKPPSKRMEL